MNSANKININYSSLVGLKAELIRKQAEVDAIRARNAGAQPQPTIKSKTKKKAQDKPKKEPKATEVEDNDDIKLHKKSQLMLMAKSRLYDNLKKSHTNANPNFLVDFMNKSDSESEVEKEERREESDDDFDDDGWVEYVDCFGRTRKCLKEDLPAMKEKDRVLSRQVSKNAEKEREFCEDKPPPDAPPTEPGLEMMRKKWEAQMEKLANKTDIHYEDVLFDEARAHGVGYYAFSQDEEERKKQQESLRKLRKETEEKQRQVQEAREKKLLMERNRLQAAKVRQKIRAGLPGELTAEEIAEIDAKYNLVDNTSTSDEVSKVEEKDAETKEKEEESKTNALTSVEDKINAFGELLGKRNKWYVMSQEEWVEKRRKIRDQEFAPKYDNFVKSTKKLSEWEEESSEGDEEIIGPMPPSESQMQNPKKGNADLEEDFVGPMPLEIPQSASMGRRLEDDVIGPMPPQVVQENVEKESSDEEEIIGPMPPPVESSTVNKQREEVKKPVLDGDQILAGLRYLRAQFEETRRSS